ARQFHGAETPEETPRGNPQRKSPKEPPGNDLTEGRDRMRQLYLPLRVWDLPVRLFHWALVILIFTAWLTQEFDRMDLHKLCGYTIMTLLLFRLAWGFVGSETARFSK